MLNYIKDIILFNKINVKTNLTTVSTPEVKSFLKRFLMLGDTPHDNMAVRVVNDERCIKFNM